MASDDNQHNAKFFFDTPCNDWTYLRFVKQFRATPSHANPRPAWTYYLRLIKAQKSPFEKASAQWVNAAVSIVRGGKSKRKSVGRVIKSGKENIQISEPQDSEPKDTHLTDEDATTDIDPPTNHQQVQILRPTTPYALSFASFDASKKYQVDGDDESLEAYLLRRDSSLLPNLAQQALIRCGVLDISDPIHSEFCAPHGFSKVMPRTPPPCDAFLRVAQEHAEFLGGQTGRPPQGPDLCTTAPNLSSLWYWYHIITLKISLNQLHFGHHFLQPLLQLRSGRISWEGNDTLQVISVRCTSSSCRLAFYGSNKATVLSSCHETLTSLRNLFGTTAITNILAFGFVLSGNRLDIYKLFALSEYSSLTHRRTCYLSLDTISSTIECMYRCLLSLDQSRIILDGLVLKSYNQDAEFF